MKLHQFNLWLVMAALGLGLGCGQSVLAPTPSPAPAEEFVSEQFTIVRLHPTAGALPDLLPAEVQKAEALQRRPFVEFDATWCPPCQDLQASLGDARMTAAFAGTYIIRLDVDEWRGRLTGTTFSAEAIPVFYELDATGTPTGRTISGAAWGENIPENMAPPLHEFFQFSSQ